MTIFHGLRLPPIGVHEYIMRIAKYARCSPVCFVMAYAYLERLAKVWFPTICSSEQQIRSAVNAKPTVGQLRLCANKPLRTPPSHYRRAVGCKAYG